LGKLSALRKQLDGTAEREKTEQELSIDRTVNNHVERLGAALEGIILRSAGEVRENAENVSERTRAALARELRTVPDLIRRLTADQDQRLTKLENRLNQSKFQSEATDSLISIMQRLEALEAREFPEPEKVDFGPTTDRIGALEISTARTVEALSKEIKELRAKLDERPKRVFVSEVVREDFSDEIKEIVTKEQ
jgi:hypothetical protein